jgi:hypothetical protein
MLNEDSIRMVRASHRDDYFLKPLYEGYSFAGLPATIQHLLGAPTTAPGLPERFYGHLPQQYDQVIMLFLDAFGWHFFQRHAETTPFLRRIIGEGVATKLSAQFPSTTTAHVTTIHSGLPVGQHGLYEWNVYEPSLNKMIIPLKFSLSGRNHPPLKNLGLNPEKLYPTRTFYQQLAASGVKSYVLQPNGIIRSVYSETMTRGAQLVGYATLADALITLTDLANNKNGKQYLHLYYDGVDSLCHHYGPEARHVEAEIELLFLALERFFHASMIDCRRKTAVIVTADHGQTSTPIDQVVYINQTLPAIIPLLAKNDQGEPLAPAGSPRDLFLHVRPEALAEAKHMLSQHLQHTAEVVSTSDLVAQGYFGSNPSEMLLKRVGNLAILSYAGRTVWWYEANRFEMRHSGGHGGLSPQELETIGLFYAYGL